MRLYQTKSALSGFTMQDTSVSYKCGILILQKTVDMHRFVDRVVFSIFRRGSKGLKVRWVRRYPSLRNFKFF